MDERVAQYLRLYSCLFQTIVQLPDRGSRSLMPKIRLTVTLDRICIILPRIIRSREKIWDR